MSNKQMKEIFSEISKNAVVENGAKTVIIGSMLDIAWGLNSRGRIGDGTSSERSLLEPIDHSSL